MKLHRKFLSYIISLLCACSSSFAQNDSIVAYSSFFVFNTTAAQSIMGYSDLFEFSTHLNPNQEIIAYSGSFTFNTITEAVDEIIVYSEAFVFNTQPAGLIIAESEPFTFDTQDDTYHVFLNVLPQGAGIVEGEGIYTEGEEVLVEASPSEGYSFASWTDDFGDEVATGEQYSFTMPAADVSLTANFEPVDYVVTVEIVPEDGGAVSGQGVYHFGDEVVLNASPAEGYSFASWTDDFGDEVATGEQYSFTMPAADVSLTANFEPVDYVVTVEIVPEDGGAVSGQGVYHFGDEVVLDAQAMEGYDFIKWTDEDNNEISETTPLVFTMPAENVHLIAIFDIIDAINEMAEYNLNIYPNPAHTNLFISSERIITNIRVINMNGQLIKDISANNYFSTIDVSDINPGIYFLQLHLLDKKIITKQIQVAE